MRRSSVLPFGLRSRWEQRKIVEARAWLLKRGYVECMDGSFVKPSAGSGNADAQDGRSGGIVQALDHEDGGK